jgi:hypothetical protein
MKLLIVVFACIVAMFVYELEVEIKPPLEEVSRYKDSLLVAYNLEQEKISTEEMVNSFLQSDKKVVSKLSDVNIYIFYLFVFLFSLIPFFFLERRVNNNKSLVHILSFCGLSLLLIALFYLIKEKVNGWLLYDLTVKEEYFKELLESPSVHAEIYQQILLLRVDSDRVFSIITDMQTSLSAILVIACLGIIWAEVRRTKR